ncbi:MAG: VOC family protein [Nocardioidaceae bacterium]
MPFARMMKICVDALDPISLGGFWAAALDLQLLPDDRGEAGLVDPSDTDRLWFNRVPQAKTVKHRVHLDIYARSLAELEDLGAAVLLPEGDDRRWTVMTDPEGGEFCAFVRDELPDRRLHGLVVDCVDAPAQARWWYDVLGGRFIDEGDWGTVTDLPELPAMTFDFVPVPEPKATTNRVHWDLAVDSIDPLLDRGATVLRRRGEDDLNWDILADPEGNEFCAFTP